jgi:hypothetical protein
LSGEGQLIYRTDLDVLKYHTGGNTWVTIGTSTDSWILNGDSGTAQTINNDNTVLITGNTYITTTVSATDTLTIDHDATSRTDTASAASPAHGTAFTVIDSVTTNATGHVTAANVKTVTLPNDNDTSLPVRNSAGTLQFTSDDVDGVRFGASGGASVTFNAATQLVTYNAINDNTTYTLTATDGTNQAGIVLTGIDPASTNTVTLIGTGTGIKINEASEVITIELQDNIDIAGTLDVTGVTTLDSELIVAGTSLSTFAGQVQVPTANDDANAPNLGQVKLLIAGVGVFQGSYNASTGQASAGPISGASNIALTQGDYFVVSVAGNDGGYFPNLEPGDFIFANADIAASSTPAVSEYTVVQADANIAGVGTTDGNTIKGVSGFNSVSFTASASGWIQLIDRSVAGTVGTASAVSTITTDAQGIVTAASETTIAITASQVTDFCAAVQTCVADNSDSVLIGDGTATSYTITHNYNTRQIAVQTVRTSTPWDTVFMDVERTTVNTITLTTTTALPSNGVEVFLQIIK